MFSNVYVYFVLALLTNHDAHNGIEVTCKFVEQSQDSGGLKHLKDGLDKVRGNAGMGASR